MKKPDISKMMTFEEHLKEALKDPVFRRHYEDLEVQDRLIRGLIENRIHKRFTQKQLAEKIGTTQSALARFESGRVNPSLDFVQKLARALDLKITITPAKSR